MSDVAGNAASTIGLILLAMAFVAVLETVIPLHARNAWHRTHLKPNLALTAVTFFTNVFLNAAVLFTLAYLEKRDWGLLNVVALEPALAIAIVVLGLDFAFYAAHVAMHKVPLFWRFHRVHHSDPALDVTTTIRQHPGEGIIRYVAIYLTAAVLGASVTAFAVYRTASALNGLLEHANIEFPRWLDTSLSWVTTWPNVHKVHHSRKSSESNTNYGNLFSWWDRLFSTFTPAHHGAVVSFGLDGHDHPARQTTAGLLALPFGDAGSNEASSLEVSPER